MVDQEVIHKLRMLSSREREILKLFCEGNKYKAIGETLFIGENTVKTHIGNIYIKLGLEHLPSSARRMIIYQTYCPAVHEFDLTSYAEEPVKPKSVDPESVKPEPVAPEPVNPEAVEPEPVEPEAVEPEPVKPEPEEPEPVAPEPVVPEPEPEPEPVPDEVIDMVNEDEHALMVVEPIIVDFPSIRKDEPEPPIVDPPITTITINYRIIGIIIFILFVIATCCGIYFARNVLFNPATPASQSAIVLNPQGNQAIPTSQPILVSTASPTLTPTETRIPPTITPAPTQIPVPKITLPFNDNFSNGINPPWKVEFGKWFVADSGASITINDVYDNVGSIVIDDPTLTNYILRVNVYTPHIFAASQGQYGVVVRYGADRDQNIIFYTDSNGNSKWAYAPSLSDLPFYLPGITDKMMDTGNSTVKLEITVNGNTFTAKVDGKKIDQFSMTGYENGGVALITACGSIGSCPSFSDLSIEPIN